MDFTGTGNSLNPVHPSVLRLIMDSLRYFAMECHVDGFRFDLASALAREFYDVDRLAVVLRRHPPGPGALAGQADRRAVGRRPRRLPGRQLPGALDGVERPLPRHDAGLLARRGQRRRLRDALHRLERPVPGGRPHAVRVDQLHHRARRLHAVGSRLAYNEKHNEANGEDNRDGTDDNRSWNCGVEGETDDPEINALRMRQRRNFLTTLFLSQGVPMLLGGDEIGRTQSGNNNAWCQDNELSWFHWELDPDREALLEFTRRIIRFRSRAPGLPARPLPRGPRRRRLTAARHLVVPARRPPHDAPRLAVGRGAPPRPVPERRCDHRADAGRRARSSTTRSCSCSTRSTSRSSSRCRRRASAGAGRSSSPRPTARWGRCSRRAVSFRSRAARPSCSRRL